MKQETPVYTTDLARRLLAIIDEKRNDKFAGKASAGRRFNLRQLAAKSGINYWTLFAYVKRRSIVMSFEAMDKIMWAMGLSILDLIQPHELAARYNSLPRQERFRVRTLASGKTPTTEVLELTDKKDLP